MPSSRMLAAGGRHVRKILDRRPDAPPQPKVPPPVVIHFNGLVARFISSFIVGARDAGGGRKYLAPGIDLRVPPVLLVPPRAERVVVHAAAVVDVAVRDPAAGTAATGRGSASALGGSTLHHLLDGVVGLSLDLLAADVGLDRLVRLLDKGGHPVLGVAQALPLQPPVLRVGAGMVVGPGVGRRAVVAAAPAELLHRVAAHRLRGRRRRSAAPCPTGSPSAPRRRGRRRSWRCAGTPARSATPRPRPRGPCSRRRSPPGAPCRSTLRSAHGPRSPCPACGSQGRSTCAANAGRTARSSPSRRAWCS